VAAVAVVDHTILGALALVVLHLAVLVVRVTIKMDLMHQMLIQALVVVVLVRTTILVVMEILVLSSSDTHFKGI
jgi:hypothetical protein